jgi:hypothetical protein
MKNCSVKLAGDYQQIFGSSRDVEIVTTARTRPSIKKSDEERATSDE